jgi:hypothetical protein
MKVLFLNKQMSATAGSHIIHVVIPALFSRI